MKKLINFILTLAVNFTAYTEIVEVVILQTTDIHAHISYDKTKKSYGDWLQLATLIKKERQLAGGITNCLLIDCGDTIQGTLIGAISKGEVSIMMLDSLNYDAWVLGNHELDFGIPRLKELINASSTPIINGNLQLSKFIPLPAFRIYEKCGAKIAVIGMNAFLLDYWVWGQKMEGFAVEKAALSVERILPEVMKLNPDMIIVALHQGLMEQDRRMRNEVKTLAYKFPQIDLILGGHTHREFFGQKIANSWYVQGGKHGEILAKVIAKIDTNKHHVINIKSQLLRSLNHSPDPACSGVIQSWLNQARSFSRKRICYTETEISSSGTPGYDCHMSEIICRAISSETNVPIVFHGVLSKVSWAKDSYLTEAALFETIPYENGIGVARLTSDQLKEIIAEQLKFKGTRSFNGIYGAVAEVDGNETSVRRIFVPGKSNLKENERISVAFNSYAIAGAGGRFPILRNILRQPRSELVEFNENSREILRRYLKNTDQWKDPPFAWFRFQNSGE